MMKKYLAIGGDAHADVGSVRKSMLNLNKVAEDAKILGIYRGGDDAFDPRFPGYEGLKLKELAKRVRAAGFNGPDRYAQVIKLYKEGLGTGDKSYSDFFWSVERAMLDIGGVVQKDGIPVHSIAGNACCLKDHFDAIYYLSSKEGMLWADELDHLDFLRPGKEVSVQVYVCGEDTPPRYSVAVVTIPYSFDKDIERLMADESGLELDIPGRQLVEESLERTLGQLGSLNPSMIVQIQHEPPVQSLVTMLDPRDRPLEAAYVYQKAIDAITDMNPDVHLIFFGHVGSRFFSEAVPHELADRGIRTFHWPENGFGGMLYLDIDSGEVREERFLTQ